MIRRALFAGTLFLLGSCAQVAEITGGEKDTLPPTLIASLPPNGSVRFSGVVILLEFDERITLDRVRDRLLVSPPLDDHPQVRVVGARSVVTGEIPPFSIAVGNPARVIRKLEPHEIKPHDHHRTQ